MCVIVLSGIAKPEAEISDGVVALRGLQAFDCILEAILGDTVIEAAALHILTWDANDLLDTARGIHDGQGTRKAVKKESSTRLMGLIFNWLLELSGQM